MHVTADIISVSFRRAVHADSDKIAMIHKTAVTGLSNSMYRDDEITAWIKALTPNEVIEAIEDASGVFEVAFLSDQIIGFGIIQKNTLVALYILPQYQNQGIGTRLLHHIEDCAKKKGTNYIHARIALSGKIFYEKKGYTILQEGIHMNIRYLAAEKYL
ncbi:MAG: GNAT family N-acetyltransferase [Desulfotignum sp.]|nr:GNAT family N-acetyltransferase [Desulfotignum sp.]